MYTFPYLSQVSNNGLFSFNEVSSLFSPEIFSSGSSRYIVAPFWDDANVRDGGSIFYEIHSCTSFNARSVELLQRVSSLISEVEEVSFLGSWMLVGMWEDLPEFSSSDVSVVC